MIVKIRNITSSQPRARDTLRNLLRSGWLKLMPYAAKAHGSLPSSDVHALHVTNVMETSTSLAPDRLPTLVQVQTILLATDDSITLDLIQLSLKHDGFAVMIARSGQQALDLTRQRCPDLLVLDRQLPDMDGISLYRQLSSESHIPTIIIAAHPTMDETIAALECGADDYLSGPYTPRELIARIRAILRRAAPRNWR